MPNLTFAAVLRVSSNCSWAHAIGSWEGTRKDPESIHRTGSAWGALMCGGARVFRAPPKNFRPDARSLRVVRLRSNSTWVRFRPRAFRQTTRGFKLLPRETPYRTIPDVRAAALRRAPPPRTTRTKSPGTPQHYFAQNLNTNAPISATLLSDVRLTEPHRPIPN